MEPTKYELERGKKLLEKEKYEDAFRLLLPCAENGIEEAQSNIGVMYQLGLGITRDIQQAIKWLSLAAENGCGEAAHNLGTLYLTSEPDIPRNQQKSSYWYRRAKELGFQSAPDEWYEAR